MCSLFYVILFTVKYFVNESFLMLVVGIHSVDEFLEKRSSEVEEVLVSSKKTNSRLLQIVKKSRAKGLNVRFFSDSLYDQGVAAVVKPAWFGVSWWDWFKNNPIKKVVVLDEVQDPHNLGACLRTACALGVDAILTPSRNSAPLNTTALKVASGAGAWVPVFAVNNLASCLKTLKDIGYWVLACSEHAETRLIDFKHDKFVLIVGNEQKGIRKNIINQSDYLFSLPTSGPIKSLNVSVALGIALTVINSN